jgi:glycosyltransferase involved in cell wall biosynthesis
MGRTSESLKGLRVCYFGHYDPSYSRNRVILKALKRAGAYVVEVRNHSRGIRRWWSLLVSGLTARFDIMFIGFPGHTDVPLGWLIASLKRHPLVFDAFLSLYDTAVFDRRNVPPNSLRAKRLFLTDKLACLLATIILLDTESHIRYFVDTFKLPPVKFRRVWVGTDDDVMFPRGAPPSDENFTVFFYGSYIPLHGAEYIVKAAHLLEARKERVFFVMVGSGQTFSEVSQLAKDLQVRSVRFIGKVPYERLAEMISKSHVCLGIFGTTPKAARVIPNKVFDALAIGRPVVTADTPAIREVFTHGENIWLVPAGDEKALAEAIIALKSDGALRDRLAANGHAIFRERFSIDAITNDITRIILEVL